MAKKKQAEIAVSDEIDFESLINKGFGQSVFIDPNNLLKEKIIIPFSPAIDLILGGGITEGTVTIVTGHPKTGKTTSILSFIKNAYLPKWGGEFCPNGRHVFYFNIEGRLKKRDLEAQGFDMSRFHIIGSTSGQILSAEQYLTAAERVINGIPGAIVIIDSFSMLLPESEKNSELTDIQIAPTTKILAKFCRRIANVVPINNSVVIGVTHQMSNIGFGNAKWKEKSGTGIGYQHDIKLKVDYAKDWKPSSAVNPIGLEIQWSCETSATDTPPGQTVKGYVRYGYGIDKPAEIAQMAVDFGLIKKSGAWFKIESEKEDDETVIQFQGLEKLRDFIADNPQVYDRFEKEIKEILNPSMAPAEEKEPQNASN